MPALSHFRARWTSSAMPRAAPPGGGERETGALQPRRDDAESEGTLRIALRPPCRPGL